MNTKKSQSIIKFFIYIFKYIEKYLKCKNYYFYSLTFLFLFLFFLIASDSIIYNIFILFTILKWTVHRLTS